MGRYGKQEAKQKHNPPVRTPTYGEIALVLSPTYPVYLRFRFPAGRARGMPISSLVVFFSLSLFQINNQFGSKRCGGMRIAISLPLCWCVFLKLPYHLDVQSGMYVTA